MIKEDLNNLKFKDLATDTHYIDKILEGKIKMEEFSGETLHLY